MTTDDIGDLIISVRKAIEEIDNQYAPLRDSITDIERDVATISDALEVASEHYPELEDLCKAADLLSTALGMLEKHSALDELDALDAELTAKVEDEGDDEDDEDEDEV